MSDAMMFSALMPMLLSLMTALMFLVNAQDVVGPELLPLVTPVIAQSKSELPRIVDDLVRVLSLRDYNTRVVLLGSTLLGAASGSIGVFLLLRKRSLLGDAISHATLPGVCIAFLAASYAGGSGKNLASLLLGAGISGMLGGLTVLLLRATRRIKEDASLGIVLSVFFGIGLILMSFIQRTLGHAAGLESFILGKTASMVASDAWLIASVCLLVMTLLGLFYNQFKILCFDEGFARSQGWPVVLLDILLMGMVVVVTIVGLQAVGSILVIALLVVPAAAARFWTNRLGRMTLIAVAIASLSSLIGAIISALSPKVPSGAAIVLVAVVVFEYSLCFGSNRGVFWQTYRDWQLRRKSDREHVMRSIYELLEAMGKTPNSGHNEPSAWLDMELLRQQRFWSRWRLSRNLYALQMDGLLLVEEPKRVCLSRQGVRYAEKIVRDHRLWELYLLHHADLTPTQVDRGADTIEHVLNAEIIERLVKMLAASTSGDIPPSPHPIDLPLPASSKPEGVR